MADRADIYLLGSSARGRLSFQVDEDALEARGPAAAAQRFVTRLLTRRGSAAASPERGADLLRQLPRLRGVMETTAFFTSAANRVIERLNTAADWPDDERLTGVSVNGVVRGRDHVTIRATLRTAAGTGVSLELPVPR